MRVARIWAITVVLFALLAPAAFGQFVAERGLTAVTVVRVIAAVTLDDADRECLRDPQVLETEAELVLRRSGIPVADASLFRFVIDVLALRIGGGLCVAVYVFQLVMPGATFNALYYQQAGVMTGPAYSFQDRLRNTTNEEASRLANAILRAKSQ